MYSFNLQYTIMRTQELSQKKVTQDIFISLQKILRCLDFGKGLRGKVPSLTVTQMKVLSFFSESSVIHISKISPILGMSVQSVNNVIQRLEVAGYVKRKPNEKNKRFSDILLTPMGKKLLVAFRNSQVNSLEYILEKLSLEEKKELTALFKNAAEILEKGRTFKK